MTDRMIPSHEPVRIVSSSILSIVSTESGCPGNRSDISPHVSHEKITKTPSCDPQTTFRPLLMIQTESNSSSSSSLFPATLCFLKSYTDKRPSPLQIRTSVLFPVHSLENKCTLLLECDLEHRYMQNRRCNPIGTYLDKITNKC